MIKIKKIVESETTSTMIIPLPEINKIYGESLGFGSGEVIVINIKDLR